jgi:hypothetical protein
MNFIFRTFLSEEELGLQATWQTLRSKERRVSHLTKEGREIVIIICCRVPAILLKVTVNSSVRWMKG